MLTKRDLLLRSAAFAAVTAAASKSVPAMAQTSAERPRFLEAKDIAEAGFIYGLPAATTKFAPAHAQTSVSPAELVR